jgi:purine-nucleoside phosphorylase
LKAEQIQIFTAVQMETRAVQAALRGRGCLVRTVGIGAKHLPPIDQVAGKGVIILCGVAGALDPSLAIGDVVLDDPARQIDALVPFRPGTIITAAEIVATPADKASLFAQTHAAAVDMEQSIVREFADRAGIPLIGLRAISDTASDTLDPAVVSLVDDLGRPRPMRIAMNLIRRPTLVPYLRRLNANTNIALAALGGAVRTVVDSLIGT